ncbi:hypothetical protein QAD02_020670 [Eretmocerus hayati]|uniref:Uncharacterized protein n=1 Tax=Eretmocerus hayati TaxID=131215 RepID=A0ACC2PN92_9HYME|nr:hypothetical protein QAD02_020670 [Eretmocerus hayati]
MLNVLAILHPDPQDLGRRLLVLVDPGNRDYIPPSLRPYNYSRGIVSMNDIDFNAQIFDAPDEKVSGIPALGIEPLLPICVNSGTKDICRHSFTNSTVPEISIIPTPNSCFRPYCENSPGLSQKQDPSQFRNQNTTGENSVPYDLSHDDTYKNTFAEESDLISYDLLNDRAKETWT